MHPTSPTPHACFIQSINDDLVNEGGIVTSLLREARLFKYGSGTGSNFSNRFAVKVSRLSRWPSSGLMSFLKMATVPPARCKSGGATRRAAKIVDRRRRPSRHRGVHRLEGVEEQKVAALVTGSKMPTKHLNGVLKARRTSSATTTSRREQPHDAQARDHARVPINAMCARVSSPSRRQRHRVPEYDTALRGRRLHHRVGTELEQPVRDDDRFPSSGQTDGKWNLTFREHYMAS